MTSWVTVNPDILNRTDNSTIVATAVREFITPRDCIYNAQWEWIWGGFEKNGAELFGGEMWKIKWSQEHEGCLCVNMNIWKSCEFYQGGAQLCGLSFPIRPGFCQMQHSVRKLQAELWYRGEAKQTSQINKESTGHLERAYYNSFSFF